MTKNKKPSAQPTRHKKLIWNSKRTTDPSRVGRLRPSGATFAHAAVQTTHAPDSKVEEFLTLRDIALAARHKLPQPLWDNLCGAADTATTLRRNRLALDSLALRQRVLVNVADIDITTTLLGQKLALPVFLAPFGRFLQLADPQGAIAVARGAISGGTTAFISTAAKPSLEDVAAAASEPLLYQLYVRSDRKWVEEILGRVKAAGYRAICLTVDRAYSNDVYLPGVDPRHQASLNWDDLTFIRQCTGLPMILKGICTAEDARLAVEHGVDVVYVSNHGGKQLDHAQASIEVLPEVVEAVDGRAEVLVDGGILRGADVIKAIALGARAVGVGKLMGLALAAGGEAGIVRMLELLKTDIHYTMGLMGVTSLAKLNPSCVRPAQPVSAVIMSDYPYFEETLRR